MSSDPEAQKRHQAWLDKTTNLPPDPYSTDAVERRAADDLRPINRAPPPPDAGADRGLAMLALVGGAAGVIAVIFIVGFAYQFVQTYPLTTAVGMAAIVVFIYLPRRWKIRSLCGAIVLCLATFAVLAINHLLQENALEKVNARESEFISAAEPQFRAIALQVVEDGLRHAQVCADCTGEASHDFYPALRRRASLATKRTTRYSRSIAGHQMNINLTVGATISLDHIRNNLPIEPKMIAYTKPELIVEFVFADKNDNYGRAPRFRNFDDLSKPEKMFVGNEITARTPIALDVMKKCWRGKAVLTTEGNENVSMVSESDTVSERHPAGYMQATVFFKCEVIQANDRRNPTNTIRFTLRSY
jgi:hypothetical protein